MTKLNKVGGDRIDKAIKDLAELTVSHLEHSGAGGEDTHKSIKSVIAALEQEIIVKVMEGTRSNQSLTAKLLGFSRGTLISRLKEMKVGRSNPGDDMLEELG